MSYDGDDKYRDQDLVVLTISIGGSPSGIAKFLVERNYTFTALVDAHNNTGSEYHIQYVPTTYFIDREGVLRHVKIGPFMSVNEIKSVVESID